MCMQQQQIHHTILYINKFLYSYSCCSVLSADIVKRILMLDTCNPAENVYIILENLFDTQSNERNVV